MRKKPTEPSDDHVCSSDSRHDSWVRSHATTRPNLDVLDREGVPGLERARGGDRLHVAVDGFGDALFHTVRSFCRGVVWVG